MDNCLISVIVPVYNCENTLHRCIDSIISQSYINLEIILVNDGSTDKSGDICDEYKSTDRRIQVIHKKNSGVSDARNSGLDIARGEYIGFIDSDDAMNPHMYSILITNILNKNADISCCNYYEIRGEEKKVIHKYREGLHEYSREEALLYYLWARLPNESKIKIAKKHSIDMQIPIITPYIWDKLYRKEIIESVRFPRDINMGEDSVFLIDSIEKSNIVVHTTEPLMDHYIYSTSLSRKSIFNNAYNVDKMIESQRMIVSNYETVLKKIFFVGYMRRLRGTYYALLCRVSPDTDGYYQLLDQTVDKAKTFMKSEFRTDFDRISRLIFRCVMISEPLTRFLFKILKFFLKVFNIQVR